MFFLRRKLQQRRLDNRRDGRGLWHRFRAAGGVKSTLLGLFFLAVVVALDCWPVEPLTYQAGQYISQDLYARVDYQVESPVLTARQRDLEAKKSPAALRFDEAALAAVIDQYRRLPGAIGQTTQPAQLPDTLRQSYDLQEASQLAGLAQWAQPDKSQQYQAQLEQLRQGLLARQVVSQLDFSKAFAKDTPNVRVLSGPLAGLTPKSRLLANTQSNELAAYVRAALGGVDASIRAIFEKNLLHLLADEGLAFYSYDEEAAQAAEDAARRAVKALQEPRRRGSVLAESNQQTGLSAEDIRRLAAEHQAFLRERDRLYPRWELYEMAGRASLLLGLVLLLGLYVQKFRPRLLLSRLLALDIAGILVLSLLLSKLAVIWLNQNPYLVVFGLFLAACALTIAVDQRFAFAVSSALVVLTALQCRLSLPTLLAVWSAPAVAVFMLNDIRTRSKLIETGAVTAAAAFLAVLAVEISRGTPLRFCLADGGYATGAALAAGFFTQGVLPLIERLFGAATSMTLLEWCDANKPLLKRLALEAPGTYNHSLLLGVMCEAAAESIGANGLVARVGAYYHDIGKLNKPDYFVENQVGPISMSRHARLSPAMSLLVIKGHVKDGLELARQYGLPRLLREFIATHHGTTLVEYFFHAAQEQARQEDLRMPEEVEFRHAGPKPRSREAAILMLGDAAESSVRAMTEPSAGRIEAQINKVITARLMDGQLDDCELTLREVREIENSLVKSLVGIYHGRIIYPSNRGEAYAPPPKIAPN
jgi:hypothetical protein